MLWIDFGLRYEMLNHFRIQPSSFPAQSCLIGLAEMVKSEGRVDSSKVIPFDTTLSWPLYTSAPRQSGSAKSLDVHSPYRRLISDLAALGNRIYMVPFQLPELAADAPLAALSVEELNFVVESMITALAPTYTVFTCEGQPEAHLFSDKLADDNILQWCLNRADTIACMVRYDSEKRFDDGIAIPSLLSRSPTWRNRLRLILTRASHAPRVPSQFTNTVLGHLPFADFVGESVSNGRVPLVDLLCRQSFHSLSAIELEYLDCLTSITHRLFPEDMAEGRKAE
jgi:hypothetical protein